MNVKWPERMRSALGALIGIAFTGGSMHLLLGPNVNIPLLVAPMGASAVLLFGVPASPLAQPWSIIGGNLVSATVGVACAMLISDPVAAAALAVGVAIAAMFALRCVHPPSGAVALTAVVGGPAIHALGFRFVLEPILIQSAALLGAALVYHAVTGHRYPHAVRAAPSVPQAPASGNSITRADLEAVLNRRGELLDIDPEDLETLFRETQLQAYARTFSEPSCRDVMSAPVVSITPDTTLRAAADLLQRHSIKALPVVDKRQHVAGIVTRADLANKPKSADLRLMEALSARLFKRDATRGRLVSTVMTTHVRTVSTSTPIVELVPLFADDGHHHIPVVDSHDRLVGIITQSDLIAGLYRQTQMQAQAQAQAQQRPAA
ncbi:HPP family protein [Paraburkholderia caribensis]|uniref:HPP family protein n=1 Tax=Paraburkholderia caribensis TaxID=75105 RepID=UPI001CAEDD70|nr:HPP family protein [Paraburkholderia caribensis]CAG9258258.1 CBS-domain-containing membrane protein [Paraburkholderia caribensis]